jgi:hypothetical protein
MDGQAAAWWQQTGSRRRMDGQAAAWRRGALAAQRAERRLAEPHAVRRCVAQLAVQPSAVRHGALMPAEQAPREEQGPREARELQGRGARLALLPVSLLVSAVARLR